MPSTPMAQILRAFRATVGWRQIDMAEAIPVDLRTYKRWEQGATRRPNLAARSRVAELMRRNQVDPKTGTRHAEAS